MLHLGVLASTRGTDMQAVIDAINSKKLNAVISVVISDKPDAYALERAKQHNLKAVFIEPKKFVVEVDGQKDREKSREQFDKEVAMVLDENKVGLILAIGYMRILSPWFVNKYRNRIMNIHPSLLPAFGGGMDRDVHQEILDYGCKVTGCTLHFVDESADSGPIIMQKAVEIAEDETVDTLKPKVQKAEGELLVKAIDLFGKGKIKVEGKKVRIV